MYSAHIKLFSFFPHLLVSEHAAIDFQPTAWASPAHTKTNRRPDDRLEVEEIFLVPENESN